MNLKRSKIVGYGWETSWAETHDFAKKRMIEVAERKASQLNQILINKIPEEFGSSLVWNTWVLPKGGTWVKEDDLYLRETRSDDGKSWKIDIATKDGKFYQTALEFEWEKE